MKIIIINIEKEDMKLLTQQLSCRNEMDKNLLTNIKYIGINLIKKHRTYIEEKR